MKYVHNTVDKNFHCKTCNVDFKAKPGLRKHEREFHSAASKTYPCTLCDYEATRSLTLKRHCQVVHIGKKPYKCSSCDYKSAIKAYLTKHIKSNHENAGKKFKCNICNKSFIQKGSECLHSGKKQKSHLCKFCPYQTNNDSYMRIHYNIVHLETNKT